MAVIQKNIEKKNKVVAVRLDNVRLHTVKKFPNRIYFVFDKDSDTHDTFLEALSQGFGKQASQRKIHDMSEDIKNYEGKAQLCDGLVHPLSIGVSYNEQKPPTITKYDQQKNELITVCDSYWDDKQSQFVARTLVQEPHFLWGDEGCVTLHIASPKNKNVYDKYKFFIKIHSFLRLKRAETRSFDEQYSDVIASIKSVGQDDGDF